MLNASCCGLTPLLFGRNKLYKIQENKTMLQVVKGSSIPMNKQQKEVKNSKIIEEEEEYSCSSVDDFVSMMNLRKKIVVFRDIIDLPPANPSISVSRLVVRTIKDLHDQFPQIVPRIRSSEMQGTSIDQVLPNFSKALKSIGDTWMMNQDGMDIFDCDIQSNEENNNPDQLAESVLGTLDRLIKIAKEKFDMMDEDEEKMINNRRDQMSSPQSIWKCPESSYTDSTNVSCCASPATPTSVLQDVMKPRDKFGNIYTSPHLLSLRLQAVGKLNPIDVKRLSFHMLPHVEAQNPRCLFKEPKSVDDENFFVRSESDEVKTKAEEIKDCCNKIETSKENVSITEEEALKAPVILEEEDTNEEVWTLAQSCPDLSINVNPPAPPPPPVLQPIVTAPPPPPPSMSLPNVAVQVQPPPPPMLQSNVVVQAYPPPPPPQPMLQSNVPTELAKTSPPPTPPTPGMLGTAPPPPPPPPLLGMSGAVLPPTPLTGISEAALPRSPSRTGKSGGAPPPPPPPPGMSGGAQTPPPMMPRNGGGPSPPPMRMGNGGAPPPPPPGGGARLSLRPKKATKLKRSSQMGNLYRILKGKFEGGTVTKSSGGRRGAAGAPAGGKQGMADALAEMTKRSVYFQQIEEDVEKYAKSITELKSAISTFQTKDMDELVKFHRQVESVLEKLTDESQVLSRFEGFPSKKLETLRTAAALYSKLNVIVAELQNWKVEAPLGQFLDKIERYFNNKIKGEIEALERTKDEEAKKFQSHNIHFDFQVLIKIKELMVDVSSNCMELALKERRAAKEAEVNGIKTKKRVAEYVKMLWRAFQFAFRVYNFAGGHDERADKLTRELAHEIETN